MLIGSPASRQNAAQPNADAFHVELHDAPNLRMNPSVPSSRLWRTLGVTLAGSLLGLSLCGAVWAVYNSRIILVPDSFDRQYQLRLALNGIEHAILICASLGASAGFASCCPMPRVKFAWSLLAVFVGSLATIVPIMWLLESVGLEMRAMKRAQPNLLLSEIVTYIAAPAIAAVAIAVLRRVLALQKKNAEQSLAAESR